MQNKDLTISQLNIIEAANEEGYNIVYIDNTFYNIVTFQKANKEFDCTTVKGQNITKLINDLATTAVVIVKNVSRAFDEAIEGGQLKIRNREFSEKYEWAVYSAK